MQQSDTARLGLGLLEILTTKFPIQTCKNDNSCNSAYVQIETLNFTFAWQAVIVYFYAEY